MSGSCSTRAPNMSMRWRAGDLGVEAELCRRLRPIAISCVGVISPAGDARDDRIRAVALDVGHEAVVGVLQRPVLRRDDVLVPRRREDRRDGRLADLAAPAAAVARPAARRTSCACGSGPGGTAPGGCAGSARTGGSTTATPARFSSTFSSSVTSGTHEPQPVPALVQRLDRADGGQLLLRGSRRRSSPLLTLLHEQICARVGQGGRRRAPRACRRVPPGRISVLGRGGSTIWFCAICSSSPYADGVADQHAAEQALARRRQHQLLVDARCAVSKS